MRSFKKGLLRQTRIENITSSYRYLHSIIATPNSIGGCSTITISFKYQGWLPGDLPETYVWNNLNTGEEIFVDGCIDLSTLTYNCIGRIQFNWDDGITC